MARYRKIDTRLHADAKFRALSSPQPCGKYLWLHLLTCPQHTAIPGVILSGPGAMAEVLGWSPKAFGEAFAEAFEQGMVEGDAKALLMWLPKATTYNKPESPNVVRAWAKVWEEVPECELKEQIYHHLKAFTKGLGEGYAKAFAEGFAESGTGTGTGTRYKKNSPTVSKKKPANSAKPSKAKPKKKAMQPTEWPSNLNRDAFATWMQYRQHRKQTAALQQATVNQQAAELAKLTHEQQFACVNHSTMNQYQGIFPEKFTGAINGTAKNEPIGALRQSRIAQGLDPDTGEPPGGW